MPPEDSVTTLPGFEPAWQHLLIIVVIAQRLWELRVSKQNELDLRARGAVEIGGAHYPAIVTLHVMWLLFMVGEVLVLNRTLNQYWLVGLGVYALAQGLRYWAMQTLGERWTTRVLVVPGSQAVTNGPYRYMKHPSYLAVFLELLVVPTIFNAVLTAVTASIVNLIMLTVRIRAESKALGQMLRGYDQVAAKSPWRLLRKKKAGAPAGISEQGDV